MLFTDAHELATYGRNIIAAIAEYTTTTPDEADAQTASNADTLTIHIRHSAYETYADIQWETRHGIYIITRTPAKTYLCFTNFHGNESSEDATPYTADPQAMALRCIDLAR